MSKQHEITTIKDLIDVVTDENVENLKNDIGEFLEYIVALRAFSPVLKIPPKFIWNDDGVDGIKAIHVTDNDGEIKETIDVQTPLNNKEKIIMSSTDINQASEDELGKTVHVDICAGASGECVYVNDYRVKGGKPWGGGTVTKSIEIKTDELLRAIEPEIQNIIRTEKLKLLAEVREQTTIFKIKAHDKKGQPHLYEAGRGVPIESLAKLEAEL